MFELILLLVGIAGFSTLFQRQRRLEREIEGLRDRLIRLDPGIAARPAPRPAAVQLPPTPARVEPPPAPTEPPTSAPPLAPETPLERERPGFESLVGGKLPIWIGGAALVVAAFFLVRYSIESGLLGPGVRTLIAAAFSAALIAASEVARRWAPIRDDARVAQVLAGAGIASAYGTLYIAATQYALVGPAAAFVLMIAITGLGMALALRHGPPTAVMALIGGFAAPMVAGFDSAGVGPLLAYLALFVAALFALAIRRGWSWLALAAVVAGFGWANLLVILLEGRDASAVAAFVVALAIGATLALPRTGVARPALRVAPLVAGFVQLLVLVPTLDFGPVAWSFYLVLAAAALVLAWRDARLLPGALAAAVLVLVLLAAAFVGTPAPSAPVAALLAALLFGGSGAAFSRRARGWAAIALVGLAGPVLVAHGFAPGLLAKPLWTLLELAAAAACAGIAWRHRDRAGANDVGLIGGSGAAALLAGIGLATVTGAAWASLPIAAVMAAAALWARRVPDARLAQIPVLVLVGLLALAAAPLAMLANAVALSLGSLDPIYPLLPTLGATLRLIAVPALAGGALLALPGSFGTTRRPVAIVVAALTTLAVYVVAKQPLAIATPRAFVDNGFIERAAITLLFVGAGWLLARRAALEPIGAALVALAVARVAWFDLLFLSPVAHPQSVGSIPVANAAVILPALLASALLTMPPRRAWRPIALVATMVAVAAAVRQITHGALLTGPMTTSENWGYSAAFLTLACAWLWRGIATQSRTLRIAGLALLTGVTLKVFLIDVAALGGLLRIVSFMGLGVALIGIGWAYGRVLGTARR